MKKIGIFILVFAAIFMGAFAAGDQSDPIITLSNLTKIYSNIIETNLSTRSNALLKDSTAALNSAYTSYQQTALARLDSAQLARGALTTAVYNKLVAQGYGQDGPRQVSLKKGDTLTGKAGSGFILLSGTATVHGGATSELVNITAGGVRKPNQTIANGIYYMIAAEDGSGIAITSPTATAQLLDGCRVVPSFTPKYTALADKLKLLGLFMGTAKGYELERTLTRQEGLVMLLRLLGETPAALAYTGSSPFTDLGYWADGVKFINYSYKQGYVNGVTPTRFVPQGSADSKVYFTYVLRALGYSDTRGDFVFNSAHEKALSVGLVTQEQYNIITQAGFFRDHTVLVSYNALFIPIKGTSQTLGQRLVSQGIITQAQYDSVK